MPAPAGSRARPLVARDLSKAYGGRVVLDGVDLVASPGLPLGVVGENGAGKSTLLRLLAGIEAPDAGEVSRPPLAYLAQEPDFGDASTVADVLDGALRPLHEAAARLELLAGRLDDASSADDYAALLDWCELRDVWSADRRAEVASQRLGLGHVPPTTRLDRLSGGQRSRLALAALVAGRPPCVLLDEPTNHLDDDAVELLESFLGDLPGVVVVASHDRAFLEVVCGQIVDLDPSHFGTDGSGGNRFSGGYADYLAEKRRSKARWRTAFEEQRDEVNRLRAATVTSARRVAHDRPPRDGDKFIYHAKGEKVAATISRRVRDLEQRIATLERERIPKPPRDLSFAGIGAVGRPGRVVLVRDLVVEGRLDIPRLDVDGGEHLLVTGANGSGKSTLLKVLAGVLAPSAGHVDVGARRVGYLPQHVTFRRPDLSARQVYDGLTGRGAGAEAVVDLSELGLVPPRDLHRPVGSLSLGQHRRLALAVIVASEPDLFLLDEPTNHISLTLAEELEEALRRTPGAVVVASHDRWLRRRWDGRRLAL
jgi:macrolide transport system ATP-binding/permease protein